MSKKTLNWILLGGGAVLIYFWWKTRAAINLNWTLSSVTPEFQGLATILHCSVLITNSSTASVSLTNVNATLYYNGSAIASGGTSATLPPGVTSIDIPFTISDITILSDVNAAFASTPNALDFQIKGTGLVNGVPVPFTTSYSIPTSIGKMGIVKQLHG